MRVELTQPLPSRIAVGSGNAFLLRGTLAPGGAKLSGIALRLGEGPTRHAEALAPRARSGPDAPVEWWALLSVPAQAPMGPTDLALIAQSEAGPVEVHLGRVILQREPDSPPTGRRPRAASADGPAITICMATYEPKRFQLERQLDSIRSQTWQNWVCVISDDASSPDALRLIEALVADDDRFLVSASSVNRGFYGNFERAMRLAPPDTDLVQLSDQDDLWHHDKLERMVATLAASPEAILAYSDMRVVDGDGRVVSDTFWYASDNNYEDVGTLAVVNTIFGVASLFRRELLDQVLPLPPAFSDQHFHDHWIAICARAAGIVAYLDEPTYDYIRHPDSVTMRSNTVWSPPPGGARHALRERARRVPRRVRLALTPNAWRTVYFDRYLLIRQFVAVLRLRLGDRMAPDVRRSLELLDSAERSPLAFGWLAARTLRPLLGRHETMGREGVLLGGILWRRLAAATRRV